MDEIVSKLFVGDIDLTQYMQDIDVTTQFDAISDDTELEFEMGKMLQTVKVPFGWRDVRVAGEEVSYQRVLNLCFIFAVN